jgi:exosortase/archaeosortase family protein
MRSTITLCALGVALTFLSDRPLWQRIIMLLSCVPIAIFSNVVRVTATSLIHIYAGEQYATGNYHTALGLATMFMAFLVFLGIGWVLSRLVVEVDEEPVEAAGS